MADENDLSGKVGLDTSGFKAGVSELTAQIKSIETGFRASAAVMGSWSTTSDGLSSRVNSLNDKLVLQKQKLETLNTEYKKAVEGQGANSKSAQSLANQMFSVEKAISSTESDLSKYTAELKKVEQQEKTNTSSLARFKSGILGLSEQSKKSTSSISGDFSHLAGVMSSAIAALGLSGLAKEGVEFNATIEQYQASFETMTGSAEKAAEITAKLKDTAAATPFELTNLADTTQLLMNYGLTSDDAISKMQMLGDISQGNSDKLKSVATAYGQMSSAGKVQLEDVKQMIEAGFNPLLEISNSTGESMSSLYDRISKGSLSVDEITQSMIRSTSEGGKYFGSMENQSKTLNGQISTLKDTISGKLGEAMTSTSTKLTSEIVPAVTNFINKIDVKALSNSIGDLITKVSGLFQFISSNGTTVKTIVESIVGAFVAYKAAILAINVVSGIMNAIEIVKAANLALSTGATLADAAATTTATGAQVGFNAALLVAGASLLKNMAQMVAHKVAALASVVATNAMAAAQAALNFVLSANPIGIVIIAIAGLVAALVTLYNKNEAFRNFVNKMWSEIKDGWTNVVNGIKKVWDSLNPLEWGKDLINGIVNGIKSKLSDIKDAAKGVASTIKSFLHFSVPDVGPLTDYESWMPDFMSGLADGMTSNIDKIKSAASSVAGTILIAAAPVSTVASKSNATGYNRTSTNAAVSPKTASTNGGTLNEATELTLNVPVNLDGGVLTTATSKFQIKKNSIKVRGKGALMPA